VIEPSSSAGIDSVMTAFGRAPDTTVPIALWSVAVFAQDIPGAERIARVMTEPARPREVRAQGHILLAHLALARGRLTAARSELGAAARLSGAEAPLVDAWFSALPFVPQSKADLDVARARLARWNAEDTASHSTHPSAFYSAHSDVHPILKTYLLGLLDARRGDRAEAMERAAELEAVGNGPEAPPLALELAQGLQAQIDLAAAGPDSALAGLEALRIESWYELTLVSPFYSGALERFTRAELLRQRGRGEDALAWYQSLGENSEKELVFLGPALLAQARIQRALGRPKQAALLYDAFLVLWQDSDPVFKAILDSARTEKSS